MPKILQLSPHVANLIAAGEVVERPSSVVKELVENAIDAGATAITVEVKDGGIEFLRIADNGSGIQPEDIVLAFSKHATSKLKTNPLTRTPLRIIILMNQRKKKETGAIIPRKTLA